MIDGLPATPDSGLGSRRNRPSARLFLKALVHVMWPARCPILCMYVPCGLRQSSSRGR